MCVCVCARARVCEEYVYVYTHSSQCRDAGRAIEIRKTGTAVNAACRKFVSPGLVTVPTTLSWLLESVCCIIIFQQPVVVVSSVSAVCIALT